MRMTLVCIMSVFTSGRFKHGLQVFLLPGFDSLPSPEVQMVRDHHGACGGSGHRVEERLGHFQREATCKNTGNS